jgi:hypothetical protein
MSDQAQSAQGWEGNINSIFTLERGPITVRIYDVDQTIWAETRDRERHRTDLEFRKVSRSALPIRYVDRDTLERMK